MRSFLVLLFCLPTALMAIVASEPVRVEPTLEVGSPLLVAPTGSVLFKVSSGKRRIACSGTFTNTDGDFDGAFRSSVRVKFGPAAEGRSNLCKITLTSADGGDAQPPVTKTVVFRVVLPKIATRTLEHVPGTTDDRTNIGAGEEVMLTVQPKEMFLDADLHWQLGSTWQPVSRGTGPAMICQAGLPARSTGKHRKTGPLNQDSFTLLVTNGTEEVTISPGDDFGSGVSGKQRDHPEHPAVGFRSPAVLTTAYAAKLNRVEAQVAAHNWPLEPVMLEVNPPRSFTVHSFFSAKGLAPALVAIASLQTRSAGSPTAEQPPELRSREIRLVAQLLLLFYRTLDPKFDPEKPPADNVVPPEGYTLRPDTSMVSSGPVRPQDIRQPALRKRYEKALTENNAKIDAYTKEARRHDDYATVQRFALTYLQELCGPSDSKLTEFQRTLTDFGTDRQTALKIATEPKDPPPSQ